MKNAANHNDLLWLTEMLSCYGSQPHRWPTGCHARVQTILDGDRRAQPILKEHQDLDALLTTLPQPSCQHLHKTILQRLPSSRPTHRSSRVAPVLSSRLSYASLLAAAILFGVFFGSFSSEAQRLTQEYIAEDSDSDLATFVAFID
ncbi:MAG: hypothetical protein GDA50_05455 [Alphaproteobacteria bacterium GM202ARS2]|nr:hypothetical protein [Alphaproteobacteria bacterium GM202ARS2]